MQTDAEANVLDVLSKRSGIERNRISRESRLVQDLKIDGDDAVDALLEVSKSCNMDVTGFDSSLYFTSEPSLLSIFRTKRLPPREITVGQLIAAAEQGRLRSD